MGQVAAARLALALAVTAPSLLFASSHREAPAISQDAVADNTDLYFFRDPNDPNFFNIIANYVGLQQPAAGPNFDRFGEGVRYEILIDNTGDAIPDVIYRFVFTTRFDNPSTFLYTTGPIAGLGAHNFAQVYTLDRIVGKKTERLVTDGAVPPANVGPRSTPGYETAFAQPSILTLQHGVQVFAGQRKDAFYVDLGSIFDLGALRPLNEFHLLARPAEAGVDGLDMMNVHAIALRLPMGLLLSQQGHVDCFGAAVTVDDGDCVIGVYASASRQETRRLGKAGQGPKNSGRWVQVSRLGFPLVNEVLIPIGEKDRWNSRFPADDLDADGFGAFIVDPELARLLPVVYPAVFNAGNVPAAPRTDVVQLLSGLAQGLSAANFLPPADLLRLNLTTPATPLASQNALGLLGGDADGFPNGRRPVDDVVDAAIQVVAGVLHPSGGAGNPANPIPGTGVPYSALGDGVGFDDEQPLLAFFPYLPTPISGYDQPATVEGSTTGP